ncbi:AzlC family ABC transporter permease [Propioniciclava soli]|uniref:AzlC family ABC transporter permease n=1 Tax=Propioniciclava soli TaxID=2775081 RepID=UPI001E5E1D9D
MPTPPTSPGMRPDAPARWGRRMTPAERMGASIAVAVGLYGVSFGALAVAAGLDVWQAVALSALMFTGGSQFAFIGVLGGGGTLPAAVTAASLLGVRNAVYAVQLNALLRPPARLRPLQAHLTIDESTATAVAQDDPDEQRRGFWTAGVGVWLLWTLFTLVGALAGEALGDPTVWGLDGAAVAAFLGLLWPRLRDRDPVVTAVAAAFVTLVAVPFVPPGVPIILAAVVSAALSLVHHRRNP